MDITYIRLTNGWMYLVAFLDWYSRYVVAWELSDTLEMDFVIACSAAALEVATPEIVNSDQGSHFTSERFTRPLLGSGVKVSMDGRGRYVDNIFTERLWRSVKYEEVYNNEYETPRDAREMPVKGCHDTCRFTMKSGCTRRWATARLLKSTIRMLAKKKGNTP